MKSDSNKMWLIILLIIGVASFEIPAYWQQWTAVQKEIWDLEEARWKALTQGDLDGFVKYHHEDGAFWPYWSDKPLNLEKFRAYLQQFKFYSADLQPDSIKVFGNTAIVQYTCEYRLTQFGVSIVVVKSRFTEIRMRQNGIWQVIGKMLHKVNQTGNLIE